MPISGRREHSLVDDWIDILLYYPIRVRLKAGFVREAIRLIPFTVRSFLKPRGDVQEDDLKLVKTKFGQLGNRSIEKKGSCIPN
jgi:hypothetical protein